jgi:hypothetical protein
LKLRHSSHPTIHASSFDIRLLNVTADVITLQKSTRQRYLADRKSLQQGYTLIQTLQTSHETWLYESQTLK